MPQEFVAACGRPGSEVQVREDRGVVRHAECDLTDVTLAWEGRGGPVVPLRGEAVSSSTGVSVERAVNGDVSWALEGEAGNA